MYERVTVVVTARNHDEAQITMTSAHTSYILVQSTEGFHWKLGCLTLSTWRYCTALFIKYISLICLIFYTLIRFWIQGKVHKLNEVIIFYHKYVYKKNI